MSSLAQLPGLARLIAGRRVTWQELCVSAETLMEVCAAEELEPLVYHRIADGDGGAGWPPSVREALANAARAAAGEELLRGAETRVVLAALAAAGIDPILIKGTPLAYSVYPTTACRPRQDTDLFIPAAKIVDARDVMASLGYLETNHCSELFSQFEVQKRDGFGVVHAFDVHWKISTQPIFEQVLTYSEMRPRARPVPTLGPHARTAGIVDALLLACVHPVMHHRNEPRALWIYDTHAVASCLTRDDFDEFGRRAKEKRVAAICAHQLRLAQTIFGTRVPPGLIAELAVVADEPSCDYLASQRRWHHELASSVRGLPRVGDRLKLLRHVLLPSPSYVLGAYGLSHKPFALWLLPALYVHRNVRGVWKILTGKK